MQIVLVHGIWDSGKVFRRMASYLNEEGHSCYTPDLLPANGAEGLVDLAEKLRIYIEGTLEAGPFALAGFSMGSLISRYYLQRLGGLERVRYFFNISGPQRGTLAAHVWPGKAARDMRFGSRFIRELNADLNKLSQIDIRTYRTPFDLLVIPSGSSKLPGSEDRLIYAPLHHRMLCQESLFKDIAATLRQRDT
ncbi:lipase [Coraliomargarita sinensis]|uniref:Lipase n=1 Tax=Coraliomargarita sinensis TaxID=2174842 RepID=A0A317ZLA6_9BACT|nr:alpha/beta fold hydrolase [Coraliomargarita sinensis]PXA05003.1 lipase [Coraliomargarita sinensis]